MRSRSREFMAFVSGVALAVTTLFVLSVLTSLHYDNSGSLRHLRDSPNANQTSVPFAIKLALHDKQLSSLEYGDHDSPVTRLLHDEVRIFCWIMTSSANTWTKAIHINATWAPRCNKYIFVTPDKKSGLPGLQTNIPETRKHLWSKTKHAFEHIYKHELDDYDWFLKADDDTYVIIDNLRFMLLTHSLDAPVYFGCRFNKFVKQGYMSGGSGYVLSREAVRRLVETGLSGPTLCRQIDTGPEDVLLGKCLERVGVLAADSRDSQNKHRMLPFSSSFHFDVVSKFPRWFKQYMYYPYKEGKDCCSDYVISFHYVFPTELYNVHNLLYRVRVFGLSTVTERNIVLTKALKSDSALINLLRTMSAAETPSSAVKAIFEEWEAQNSTGKY